MSKLLRITTVSESLRVLLRGQLTYMREQGFEVWTASAGDETTIEGCPHSCVPLTRRRFTPVQDLWALIKLYMLMLRFRPAIVHTHTPKAGLIGMIAARLAGVPIRLHTVAGLPLMEKQGLWRWGLLQAERLTYAFATHVWPNSFGLETYIQAQIYNGSKLRVIGNGSSNGVDTNYFRVTAQLSEQAQLLRRQLLIPADAFIWVFVGRLVHDKGVEELITAFLAVAAWQHRTRLILVGQEEDALDPISDETKALIAASDDILQVGYQTDVRPYMLLADALVLPSYREGLPNVLMQAACLERPVVATDIVGCREVVRDGETGLLVPPKDAIALRDAMLRLMLKPELGQQMGQAARAFVVSRYDQAALWQTLVGEYQQALQTAQRA